jgi:hypothetical protein
MQNRLYVVVSEPFLETAAMEVGFLSQWEKHYCTYVGVFKTNFFSEVLAASHLL